MADLTKIMKDLLNNADLERAEITSVPLSTAYALEDRGLVTSDWHGPGPQTTQGGDFPRIDGVKLTALGVQEARKIKGLAD